MRRKRTLQIYKEIGKTKRIWRFFLTFAAQNTKTSDMTTITLSYNERNKTAQAVVKFLESLGVFKILKDDEPNATTIKAIEETKAGKTYKATSLQDMLNYLRN